MKATIDGTLSFDQESLRVESFDRDSIERSAAGLDGVVSVDLGARTRSLVQRGLLRAGSKKSLESNLDVFAGLVDGEVHTLVIEGGRSFGNLKVDSFEILSRNYSGLGVCCKFEIRYTQLSNE